MGPSDITSRVEFAGLGVGVRQHDRLHEMHPVRAILWDLFQAIGFQISTIHDDKE